MLEKIVIKKYLTSRRKIRQYTYKKLKTKISNKDEVKVNIKKKIIRTRTKTI